MWKAWYWRTWLGAWETQVVCMEVVRSSSVTRPKFGEKCFKCKRGTVLYSEHCPSKHKITRRARNLRRAWSHWPLMATPVVTRKEWKRRKSSLLTWCSSFHWKKFAVTQDFQTLQNSDEKQCCQYWILRLVVTKYIACKQRLLVEALYVS